MGLADPRVWTVAQIVREHYLRDDLGCGAQVCGQCEQTEQQTPLQRTPVSHSQGVPEPHLLLPDTNVILHQVSLLHQPVVGLQLPRAAST